jgi:hypothetical protein
LLIFLYITYAYLLNFLPKKNLINYNKIVNNLNYTYFNLSKFTMFEKKFKLLFNSINFLVNSFNFSYFIDLNLKLYFLKFLLKNFYKIKLLKIKSLIFKTFFFKRKKKINFKNYILKNIILNFTLNLKLYF